MTKKRIVINIRPYIMLDGALEPAHDFEKQSLEEASNNPVAIGNPQSSDIGRFEKLRVEFSQIPSVVKQSKSRASKSKEGKQQISPKKPKSTKKQRAEQQVSSNIPESSRKQREKQQVSAKRPKSTRKQERMAIAEAVVRRLQEQENRQKQVTGSRGVDLNSSITPQANISESEIPKHPGVIYDTSGNYSTADGHRHSSGGLSQHITDAQYDGFGSLDEDVTEY